MDVLALAYKYYYKSPTEDFFGNSAYFKNQRKQLQALKYQEEESFECSLSIGGDLLPYARLLEADPSHFWSECGGWFFGSDLVFANLETPIDLNKPVSAVPEVMLNDMYFNGSEAFYDLFSGGGHYDVLSLANNHALDQGVAGLEATMSLLEARNVGGVGAAKKGRQAWKLIEKNGLKLSFHAWTYSLNKSSQSADQSMQVNHLRLNQARVDLKEVVNEIQAAKKQGADFSFLYLHMGNAYHLVPSEHVRANLKLLCAESGADLVVCGHGHNMQVAEVLHGVPVFHSLGDFVSADIYKGCRFPLMLKIHLRKKPGDHVLLRFEARPAYLDLQNAAQARMRFLECNARDEGIIREPQLKLWWKHAQEVMNIW